MSKMFGSAAIAAAIALGLPVAAHAGIFVGGSLAIAAFTNTTSDLATTSIFHLSPPSLLLGSGAGDFTGLAATIGVGSTLNTGNATTFDFTDPALGSFVADPGAVLMLPSSPGVKSFFVSGHFTVGSDFLNAGTVLTADETFSLTQTSGAGNSISISGTFQSPLVRPPSAPEPGSLALLGSGLIALATLVRRRRIRA